MSNKELVIETIRKLPEEATIDEIVDEVVLLASLRKGEEDADAGRLVPQEEARRRLAKWLTR